MTTQPEALLLADALTKHLGGNTATQAAAELRRLHEVNQELLEILKQIAALKRPDPCRRESNANRWVTWTVRVELVQQVDAAIAHAEWKA